MTDKTYTDGVTLTDADSFNDWNRLHYTIFGDPANTVSAAAAIGLDFTNVRVGGTLSVSAQAALINLQVAGVLSASAGAVFNALATTDLSASSVAGLAVATQAQMETGSSTSTIVSPGRTHFHPASAKAWVIFNGAATSVTAASAYNVTSITDLGTGAYQVNFTTPFSGNNYSAIACSNGEQSQVRSVSAGSAGILIRDSLGTLADATTVCFVAYGDL